VATQSACELTKCSSTDHPSPVSWGMKGTGRRGRGRAVGYSQLSNAFFASGPDAESCGRAATGRRAPVANGSYVYAAVFVTHYRYRLGLCRMPFSGRSLYMAEKSIQTNTATIARIPIFFSPNAVNHWHTQREVRSSTPPPH